MKTLSRFVACAVLCLSLIALFSCSSSDSADPLARAILVSGTSTWAFNGHADLDAGSFPVSGNSSSDFYYGDEPPGFSSTIYTVPGGQDSGARLVYLGAVDFDAVTWEQVSAATMTAHLAGSISYPADTVIGYKTAPGRYGKLKLLVKDTTTSDWTLTYVTWQ